LLSFRLISSAHPSGRAVTAAAAAAVQPHIDANNRTKETEVIQRAPGERRQMVDIVPRVCLFILVGTVNFFFVFFQFVSVHVLDIFSFLLLC
jgi:hypothetical protein